MTACIHISRANLGVIERSLGIVAEKDVRVRSYYRTVEDVMADWRNQNNDVPIRLRREFLKDMVEFLERCGPHPLPEIEHERLNAIRFAKHDYPAVPL